MNRQVPIQMINLLIKTTTVPNEKLLVNCELIDTNPNN